MCYNSVIMKVKTKKLSETKVELTVALDKDVLMGAREKAVAKLVKTVKIAGFRQGKVPAKMAEPYLDPNTVLSEEVDTAVKTTIMEAFAEAKVQPLVMPEVNVTKFVPEETLEYTATAEILPEIKLGDYKKLVAKTTETKITKKEIDEVLGRIASAYAKHTEVKRAAKKHDEVIIDFTGKKDGKAFAGGHAEDFPLELGSGQFIAGFEEGLIGKKAGEETVLDLTFPKDYHAAELAGAKVQFEVKIKTVKELELPEYNAEFAKKCGPFKTMAELEKDIEKNLRAQKEQEATEKMKDELIADLVKKSKVVAPEILIQDQLRFIRSDMENNAKYRGMSPEEYLKLLKIEEAEWEKEAKVTAEARVKASLVLQKVALEEKIAVEEKVVNEKIAALKHAYAKAPEMKKSLDDPRVIADLRNRLVIEKTMDFLLEINGLKEKKAKAQKK